MQQITISGVLLYDSEKCTDSRGRNYRRFVVSCASYDKYSRKIYTNYICFCYIAALGELRRHDQVFVTGKLSLGVQYDDNGNASPLATVMVHQISAGAREADARKDRNDNEE